MRRKRRLLLKRDAAEIRNACLAPQQCDSLIDILRSASWAWTQSVI